MGTIRTLLALLVVLGHIIGFDPLSRPALGGAATTAVNLFFVMSGFYMALVLETKYQRDILAFYKARALRLYPLYWITALATLALIYAGFSGPINPWRMIGEMPIWAVMSNVTFIGLDAAFFFDAQGYTIVPQAWTLGVEVTFYLLIPFILRMGWAGIIGALAISIAVNLGLKIAGLVQPPWDRMFFPALLMYFMLGVVAYKAHVILRLKTLPPLPLILGLAVALCLYAAIIPRYYAIHNLRPWPDPFFEVALVVLFCIALPFLFRVTQDSQMDRAIGELSYPIYITHVSTLAVTSAYLAFDSGFVRTGVHLAIVMVVAIFSALMIRPLERTRGKYLNKLTRTEGKSQRPA